MSRKEYIAYLCHEYLSGDKRHVLEACEENGSVAIEVFVIISHSSASLGVNFLQEIIDFQANNSTEAKNETQ